VRHGEYISVYCNLGNIRVKSGDSIKAGTIIGDVLPEVSGGNPRMLFQLRKEKKTLNPAEWLKM
jgi:septal ring factor EnvC (AmiA/AmiB activator)